nr:hypothetical protein [Sulfurovaceae bacterium]
EMLTHIPICTHANPESILIIGGCSKIIEEVKKHNIIRDILQIKEENAEEAIKNLDDNRFDIIIIATDIFLTNKLFWGFVNKVLTAKGIVSTVSSRILTQETDVEKELETIGEIFKIVMPYKYEASAHGTGLSCKNAILASHSYHPIADINLQRADLTDGFNYYNSDIAIGAFHLPTVTRTRFLGLIKL